MIRFGAASLHFGLVAVTPSPVWGLVACSLELPRLDEAVRERGLRLVGMPDAGPQRVGAAAALLGWGAGLGDPAARLAGMRAQGWDGPVVLVLAQDCGADVVRALDAGADDAVVQPVGAPEVAARVAARLRHRPPPGTSLRLGSLHIDRIARTATRDGRVLDLLPREYALLVHLAEHAGRTVGKRELLSAVWRLGFDPGTNVVEVHVSRLRAKLDPDGAPPMLHTHRRAGYRLMP
ncbi:MAG: response regulator transcription factor [Pseudomonadota bacterium]